MTDEGFAIVDGVFYMDGDAYPSADLECLFGLYAEFMINGFELFVWWGGMFDGATSLHAQVALNDLRHDNWYETMAFSDWTAAGNDTQYDWATPADVRLLMARLFGGWIPQSGEHSGVGMRLPEGNG
jgi:hypothetical protein